MPGLDDFHHAQSLTYEDHWGDHYEGRPDLDSEPRNASLALSPPAHEPDPLDEERRREYLGLSDRDYGHPYGRRTD